MRSIRVQLISFVAVILLLLLILLNTYPLTSSRDRVFEEKKNFLSTQANVIASSLSALERPNQDSIGEVLRILEVGGFARTVVVDKDGVVLYDTGNGKNVGRPTDIEALDTALDGKIVFRSLFADSAFESSCAVPMSSQGNTVGAVYVDEYDSERAEIILNLQRQLRVISFAIAGLAIICAIAFSQALYSRISELVRSMRIVAAGDYDYRLDTRGKDEIAELGNEFNELTSRLQSTEKQRRQFVSDASHELKTPLASIRLLTDSILQSKNIDTDTVMEFVADIGSEAGRLQRTTEKLLDLSRLDDDVQVIAEPVDFKQVILDTLVVLRPLAAERKVKIKGELDEGCVIMATVDDVFHIVFNLMENAVKYNVDGGSVNIRLEQDEKEVKFTVADTGIGIPEEDRLNIFSRFYRVDKARSREAGGSGLGLSIVHDAVQLHGGTITVGANKPNGSIFIVAFPRPTQEETGI